MGFWESIKFIKKFDGTMKYKIKCIDETLEILPDLANLIDKLLLVIFVIDY
jgi:hypothetical protein